MTYPTISPSLTLDFAKSEQLDPRISFTRSSTGTYLDSDGLIKTAPSGVARFEYDSSGKALGLLIEESRTNVAPRSQEFTNSAWFKTGMTATDNVAVAPDGTTTAATLMDNGTNNIHHGLYQAQASRTDFTQSFFVKPNGNNYVNLRASTGSTSDWHTITFALIGDGSVTQSLAGSNSPYTNVKGTIIALANGWYRISMSGSRSAGNAYVLNLDAATGATETLDAGYGLQQTYTSNTSKGYYIWGGQLEEEVFPTSYIPTTSSTVTRAADVCEATLPNLLNGSEGVFVTYATVQNSSINNHYIVQPIDTANTGNTMTLLASANYSFTVYDNNTETVRINYLAYQTGVKTVAAHAYATDNTSYITDGVVRGTDTSCSMPSALNKLYIFANSARPAYSLVTGHFHRLVYYDRRASDAELETLTS